MGISRFASSLGSDSMQAVTFTESSAYDSDGDGEHNESSSSATLASGSGVLLGFDDGKILDAGDERRLDLSRLGGQAVSLTPFECFYDLSRDKKVSTINQHRNMAVGI